jgi:hypothetical protein
MRKGNAQSVALGGVFAALAVVIMSLGTLIPFATYVCPMICMVLCQAVCRLCGKRMGWAFYGAVAILSVLLSADKESAALFVMLGYYPIVRPLFEKLPWKVLAKAVYFNAVILLMYAALFYLLGMGQLREEYRELGTWGMIVTLLLGNVVFFSLDQVLPRFLLKKR